MVVFDANFEEILVKTEERDAAKHKNDEDIKTIRKVPHLLNSLVRPYNYPSTPHTPKTEVT